MPLIQGGPPIWVWERTPDPLKWEVLPFQQPDGGTHYALVMRCGLEVVRVQLIGGDELKELASLITTQVPG